MVVFLPPLRHSDMSETRSLRKASPTPAWSYSSIKLFEQCPKKYFHLKVAKDFVEYPTEATLYGGKFHKAAEEYIKGGIPLPEYFNFAKEALDKLNSMDGEKLCEYRMGLTRDLEPCTFGSRNVWWRGIVDLAILDRERNKAFIVDYKTGKSAQYADKDQLELMALAIFKHFPEITQVKAGLLFVVCNAFVKDKYDHEMQEDAWQKWTGQYDRLLEAYSTGVWNPKTSGLCRKHCPVLSCTHNGKNN
ncbi:MAG: PD-(D/E)XK nuclease family protein [Betaproteobacteria bacterium]|nr:PD-(D/E)XK nuclease family protein [Betaproteobacteria bacterium]